LIVDEDLEVPGSSAGSQALCTVKLAGGGAALRTFVIVQTAESPKASVIEPSAAQSPPIVDV
jgi:hypothetical protein